MHVNRKLKSISEIFGKTDAHSFRAREHGQLQVSTFNDSTNRWRRPTYLDYLHAPSADRNKFIDPLGFLTKLKNRYIDPITSQLTAQLRGLNVFGVKVDIGDKFGYDSSGWEKTRPELSTIVSEVDLANIAYVSNDKFETGNDTKFTTEARFLQYFSAEPTSPSIVSRNDPGLWPTHLGIKIQVKKYHI